MRRYTEICGQQLDRLPPVRASSLRDTSVYLPISPHISAYLLRDTSATRPRRTGSPLAAPFSLAHGGLPTSVHISPYLPISPHISAYLPISPHISAYLPISPHISPHLRISLARPRGVGERRRARVVQIGLPHPHHRVGLARRLTPWERRCRVVKTAPKPASARGAKAAEHSRGVRLVQPRFEGQESRAPRIYGRASLRCQCDEPVGGGGVADHRREDEALVGERRVPVINEGGEYGTNEVRGTRR